MIAPLRLRSRGGRQHRLRPLPKMLVAALHWLLAVCTSRLFNQFWADAAASARAEDEREAMAEAEEPPLPPLPTREVSSISHEEAALEEEEWFCRALVAVRAAWVDAYCGIVTRSAKLDELRQYVRRLLHERELQTLESTASGILTQSPDAAGGETDGSLESVEAWPVLSPNPEWQREAAAELAQLAHVCDVREVLPRVRGCLSLFEAWIEPKADEPLSLSTVQRTAAELTSVLAAHWDGATLATLQQFAQLAERVDARLLSFEVELFEAVQACGELVRWYRVTPDEQNFTTSVEMAMGRSQMECPDALWNHTQRCVDEGKLSMLSSARAFLHEHLFGSGEDDPRLASIRPRVGEDDPEKTSPEAAPHEQYTYATIVDVFSRLDWRKAASVAHALRVCGPLVAAFIGLMGSDADAAAPHRLAALQSRQMGARFCCSSMPPLLPATRQGSGASTHEEPDGETGAIPTTEVTMSASEDGFMIAPARTASHATQKSAASVEEARTGLATAPLDGGGRAQQPSVWLEYFVVRDGRRVAHVLPLSEILDCERQLGTFAGGSRFADSRRERIAFSPTSDPSSASLTLLCLRPAVGSPDNGRAGDLT